VQKFFRDLPIKRKLIFIVLSTSVIVLLSASFVFIMDALSNSRRHLIESNLALIRVMGVNTNATLVFKDQDTANEILAGLEEESNVLGAQLYDQNGNLFASYRNSAPSQRLLMKKITPEINKLDWLKEGESEYLFRPGYLAFHHSIMLDNKPVGYLDVQIHLLSLQQNIRHQLLITAVVLLVTFLLAYLLASNLQILISGPISRLTQGMNRVSKQVDYSLRLNSERTDELGILMDGFNAMLEQIQNRDKALEQAVNELRIAKNIAESANQAKDEFLAAMSHELRSPLTFEN